MIKVLISGANGRMGQVVADLVSKSADFTVISGFDKEDSSAFSFPI